MFSAVLAAAMLMAETTPAAAADAAAPAAVAAPAAAAKGPKLNKDGMVCHTEEILGTHFPKKICMTPAQAEDNARQAQEGLNHMQAASH
jgi:hypothetical protein